MPLAWLGAPTNAIWLGGIAVRRWWSLLMHKRLVMRWSLQPVQLGVELECIAALHPSDETPCCQVKRSVWRCIRRDVFICAHVGARELAKTKNWGESGKSTKAVDGKKKDVCKLSMRQTRESKKQGGCVREKERAWAVFRTEIQIWVKTHFRMETVWGQAVQWFLCNAFENILNRTENLKT